MNIWVHGYSSTRLFKYMVIQVHVYSAYGLNRWFVCGTVDTVIDEFHFIPVGLGLAFSFTQSYINIQLVN